MQNIRNFVIIAHIDHGKSTLADRLLELTGTVEKRKMQEQYLDTMELERERGITIKLQPVRMKYKNKGEEYLLNLIDTPGHVDFSYEVSRSLAAVEGALLLVDASKGVQAQTLANLHLAQKQNLVIIPVINKIDLPAARVTEVEEEITSILDVKAAEILKVSAKEGKGIQEILEAVVDRIPPPKIPSEDKPFQALIFDSQFDTFKGVIAFVRVTEGSIKPRDQITLCASNTTTEVIELGHLSPHLTKDDELTAGTIGYIATGLKDVGQVRVGDTIGVGNTKPLPGYTEPRPVVFASMYPEDSDDYDTLRDALGKLKLTDASLTYEPESSPGLGRGYRLGFLGMLHIEIISERLRREFKLILIVSTPSVQYNIGLKNGEKESVRSAARLPDASRIENIAEPMVKLDILTPVEYQGSLMTLLADYRSAFVETEYLSKEIMILRYDVPLAEIITDFYDKLKSVSSGYASMNYEPIGYRIADLVRLDILVAGDLVEPFSRIVDRSRAFSVGRSAVEKLKELLPKQMFVVAIQAAIGGKIIARETISAMRKDVTAKLYGGDVTRKKKLLEKQKKGKAKMKDSGRVSIPQDVFLKMLKK